MSEPLTTRMEILQMVCGAIHDSGYPPGYPTDELSRYIFEQAMITGAVGGSCLEARNRDRADASAADPGDN